MIQKNNNPLNDFLVLMTKISVYITYSSIPFHAMQRTQRSFLIFQQEELGQARIDN